MEMKTPHTFFPLFVALMIGVVSEMAAQDRRQADRGRQYQRNSWSDFEDEDDEDENHRCRNHHKNGKGKRHPYQPTVCHHSHYCDPSARVRHQHSSPRYIYYRDYDIYYDFHRRVYITFTHNGWTITREIPVRLSRIDRRRAVCLEVEYDRDDFTQYLARHRPAYRRIYKDW